ncbi:MAG TPA: STAS domain-containing protein [Actinomycetota bacterium]|nr:STAS domain-containing protein [Actinomycetota bacterium]
MKSEPTAQGVFLYVHGELDISVVDILERQLAAAEAEGHQTITLDLEALTFMDSSGLGMCIAASQRAANQGWSFNIVNASAVRRVFEVSGLTMLLSD